MAQRCHVKVTWILQPGVLREIQTGREPARNTDSDLYEICRREKRCLVTLDLDFANVLRFSPEEASGIVVIRAPHNPTISLLEELISRFLAKTECLSIESQLWIIEVDRIRVHKSEENEEPRNPQEAD